MLSTVIKHNQLYINATHIVKVDHFEDAALFITYITGEAERLDFADNEECQEFLTNFVRATGRY